jgi:aconitate hydratase
MGAELGLSTSIFPSDQVTREFLKAQNREADFVEMQADIGAVYDDKVVIDLSEIEPMVAQPHMPDNVVPVKELNKKPLSQVFIGSCTNSSYTDIVKVSKILQGKTVHPNVELGISPGSRQVFEMAARNGVITELIKSGARILEVGCTACAGYGFAPGSGGVSLRSTNRNFIGRSGTSDALVYLASAETCAASALSGYFTTAQEYASVLSSVKEPLKFLSDDYMFILPSNNPKRIIVKGPNIKPLPAFDPLPNIIDSKVEIKLEDNITTDHIIPASGNVIRLRSNVPAISKYVLSRIDETFVERVIESEGGIIVAGNNYGQGSSREHAALCLRYLNIRIVIAKSYARIHVQNLVNFGVLPLLFTNQNDYDDLCQGDQLYFADLPDSISTNHIVALNTTQNKEIILTHNLSKVQEEVIISGGKLSYIKKKGY